MSIVLRVSGARLVLDACESWIPKERLEASWVPGQQQGRRVVTTSGFNLLLADDEQLDASIASARDVLGGLAKPLGDLADAGVSIVVDVALFVYAGRPTSVSMPPEFLAAVLAARATLAVSAYPTSDDE
jgi:hypothetical protein